MSDPLTLALTLSAVAGVWLLLCSAVAVGVYLGMLTLHYRVLRQDQAAAASAPGAEGSAGDGQMG